MGEGDASRTRQERWLLKGKMLMIGQLGYYMQLPFIWVALQMGTAVRPLGYKPCFRTINPSSLTLVTSRVPTGPVRQWAPSPTPWGRTVSKPAKETLPSARSCVWSAQSYLFMAPLGSGLRMVCFIK
jgi:hypothetical protein